MNEKAIFLYPSYHYHLFDYHCQDRRYSSYYRKVELKHNTHYMINNIIIKEKCALSCNDFISRWVLSSIILLFTIIIINIVITAIRTLLTTTTS